MNDDALHYTSGQDDDAYYPYDDDDFFWESDITTIDVGEEALQVVVLTSLTLLVLLPWLVAGRFHQIFLTCCPGLEWDDSNEEDESENATLKYSDAYWHELPRKVQRAARQLGYTKALWNGDKEPAQIQDLDWHDLSEPQQVSARVLGYTPELWDVDEEESESDSSSDDESEACRDEPSCAASSSRGGVVVDMTTSHNHPLSAASTASTDSNFDDYDWDELPESVQQAAATLGYTAQLWDHNQEPQLCQSQYWHELTPAQQESAQVLGYNQLLWDGNSITQQDEEASAQAITTQGNNAVDTTLTSVDYDNCYWNELPEHVQAAARELGYTEMIWNDERETSVSDYNWADLSIDQQHNASILGYDQEKWDDEDNVNDTTFSSANTHDVTIGMSGSARVTDLLQGDDEDGSVHDEESSTASGLSNVASAVLKSLTASTLTVAAGNVPTRQASPTNSQNQQIQPPQQQPENDHHDRSQNRQDALMGALDQITSENDEESVQQRALTEANLFGRDFSNTASTRDEEPNGPYIRIPPQVESARNSFGNMSPQEAYFRRTVTDDEDDDEGSIAGRPVGSVISSLFDGDAASVGYVSNVGEGEKTASSRSPPTTRRSKVTKQQEQTEKNSNKIPTILPSTKRNKTRPISNEEGSVVTHHTMLSHVTGAFTALLQARPHTRGTRLRRNLKRKNQLRLRNVNDSHGTVVDHATVAGYGLTDERSLATAGARSAPTILGTTDRSPVYEGIPFHLRAGSMVDVDQDEDLSFAPSILNRTGGFVNDHSFHEPAADASLTSYPTATLPPAPAEEALETTDDLENFQDDGCCQSFFWCHPMVLYRAFRKFVQIANCDKETGHLMKLGFPFLFLSIVEGALDIGIVSLIGLRMGTVELSAYVVSETLLGISGGFLSGMIESLITICSHAVGSRKFALAGEYVQISVWMYLLCLIPHALFWSFYMKPMIEFFHFEEDVALAGQAYTRIALWAGVLEEMSSALHSLFYVADCVVFSTVIETLHSTYYLLAVLFYTMYFDPTLEEIAWAFTAVSGLFVIIDLLVVRFSGWFTEYLPGLFGAGALCNSKAVRVVFRTALPLSIGYVLSYGEWEILVFLAGQLGPAEVAAWGILGFVWDTLESITLAIGDAAEVRCAYWLGVGRPSVARLSVYKSLLLGMLVGAVLSAAILVLQDDLPPWLTKDPVLQGLIADCIPLMAVGNLSMTFGSLSWTLVGSQGKYGLATLHVLLGSWIVTLPLAVVASVHFHWSIEAQLATVVIGYMISGTLNSVTLLHSDWKEISKDVMLEQAEANRHGDEEEEDEDD